MERAVFDVRTPGRAGGRTAWAQAITVGDAFDRAAECYPGTGVVFPDERCSYPELADRAERFARGLRALGIGLSSKVGLMLLPDLDNLAMLGAVAKVGAIAVPINTRFKARELRYVIANADLEAVLVAPSNVDAVDYPELIAAALPGLAAGDLDATPRLRHVVLFGDGSRPGMIDRADFLAGADAVAPAEIDALQERVRLRDPAYIMYTSGTEANPKGCLLSHEAIVRNAQCIAYTRFAMSPEDRMWDPLPLFHTGGILLFLTCLVSGCAFVHSGFFDPAVALEQLQAERCTIAHPGFETIWLPILAQPGFAEADLSALRAVLCVGVPERLRAMAARLPQATHFSCFASTEASSHMSLTLPDDDPEVAFTTGGVLMPGMQARIIDPDTGGDLAPGAEGEVVFRGPHCFDGYYGEPELNARVFDADGWFHSGDVGVLDAAGRLTFKGRLKDMLKVGGENVGAAEIENLIAEHPAVQIVQVVAAPDPKYVEVPVAFIQLVAGAAATEQEIIAHCRGRIASFKVPRHVRFLTVWPMSGTKIRKVELRASIRDELLGAGAGPAGAAS